MKKLIIFVILLFAVIAAGIVFLMLSKSEEKSVPGTTGLPIKAARYYWPGSFWKDIAERKGWFKEAGLNVELIDTNADYYKSLDDTAGGKIDENEFYLFSLIQYNLKGVGLVGIVQTDCSNGVDGIVARQEIKSIRGLKGKTIGLSKGSFHEYFLSTILMKNKLDISDVILVNMACEKTADEFIQGRVDAIACWEPLMSKAVKEGKGRNLCTTAEIPGIGSVLAVFSRKFIEERPEDVKAFVNVWNKTTNFIKENPKEAFRIIADIYKVPEAEVVMLAQQDQISELHDNITAFNYGTGFESLYGLAYKIEEFVNRKNMGDRLDLDMLEYLDGQFISVLSKERE